MSSTVGDPQANRIVPPATGSDGDPTHNGGTLVVYNVAGSNQIVTVTLPASGWKVRGHAGHPRGYVYRGSSPAEAIARVVVAPDRLVVRGGGPAWTYRLQAPAQGRVAVRLTLGRAPAACAAAGARAARSDHPGLFEGAAESAPQSCPAGDGPG